MTFRVVAIPILAAIFLASPTIAGADGAGDEQRRRDRGGDQRRDGDRGRNYGRPNRPGPRVRVAVPSRPIVNVNIAGRSRYYGPSHYHRWARSYYHWSPIHYAPWSMIAGSVGFANFGVYGSMGPSYGYGHPHYAYGPGSPYSTGYDFGGVRLRIRPRDAQVFVDGYYAGLVDDFDGTFQQLRLEQGGHKIEIRMPGFEDFEMDVHVQPGRTVTLHEDLRPRP
jgi:hypothetical protein